MSSALSRERPTHPPFHRSLVTQDAQRGPFQRERSVQVQRLQLCSRKRRGGLEQIRLPRGPKHHSGELSLRTFRQRQVRIKALRRSCNADIDLGPIGGQGRLSERPYRKAASVPMEAKMITSIRVLRVSNFCARVMRAGFMRSTSTPFMRR